jgi:hypothetical protein
MSAPTGKPHMRLIARECLQMGPKRTSEAAGATAAFRERAEVDSLPSGRALWQVEKKPLLPPGSGSRLRPQAASGSATSSARILAFPSSFGAADVGCRRGDACSIETGQATQTATDAAILFATTSESINGVNMVLHLESCELTISLSELRRAGFPLRALRPLPSQNSAALFDVYARAKCHTPPRAFQAWGELRSNGAP